LSEVFHNEKGRNDISVFNEKRLFQTPMSFYQEAPSKLQSQLRLKRCRNSNPSKAETSIHFNPDSKS
jgi:hypothetical protein